MSKFKDERCEELFSEINQLVQGIEDKPFYEAEYEQLEMMFKLSSLSPYFGKWLEKNKEDHYSRVRRTKRRIREDKKGRV